MVGMGSSLGRVGACSDSSWGLQHQDPATELPLVTVHHRSTARRRVRGPEVMWLLEHGSVRAWMNAQCARGRVVLRPYTMSSVLSWALNIVGTAR
jgi:hypothetical protein